MANKHVDVLIIGAGLSGIGAACHLRKKCPGKSFTVLERRKAIGGTWDLFRYPGIRSDSDMFTLGYSFKPWSEPKVLADGGSIKSYIHEAARENDVEKEIQFGLKVVKSNWDSSSKTWTVETLREDTGETEIYTSNFLFSCTGYYNYDGGFTPEFPGIDDFKGEVIHPQKWPENLDYSGKKVVIIGSGATAVTLVPAMADKAGHVTMLQRSPSYIATVPAIDPISVQMRRFLPEKVVYHAARARNIGIQRMVFKLSKSRPGAVRRLLLAAAKKQLGAEFDMKHFTPSYNPWDERLCAVPNGDLFKVLRKGDASVVTDHIDTFTAKGIKLKSGEELEADIIITATGLELQMLGGQNLSVDGKPVNFSEKMTYKGVMASDVPNLAVVVGYTNSSWTLKADIACEYVCRLINYMDAVGAREATPRDHDNCVTDETVMEMQSGYLQRGRHHLPRQGSKAPWKVVQNYFYDLPILKFGSIADDYLQFDQVNKPKRTGISGLLSAIPGLAREGA